MKVNAKQFLIWTSCWGIFIMLMLLFLSEMKTSDEFLNLTIESRKSFLEILVNNSYNFLTYLLFFPLSILLTLYEMLVMAVSFYLGVQIYGVNRTFLLLIPHGILELPNILFYSFLSFNMFKSVIKEPSVKTIKQVLISNRYYYLNSYSALVIAAWIEGGLL